MASTTWTKGETGERERESRAETASPCAQASGRPCSCLLHLLPLPQGLPWRNGGVGQGRRGRQSGAGQGREARSLRGLLQRTAAAARRGRGCRAGAAHRDMDAPRCAPPLQGERGSSRNGGGRGLLGLSSLSWVGSSRPLGCSARL